MELNGLLMNRNLSLDQFSMVPDTDNDTNSVDVFHPDFLQGQSPVGTMITDKNSGAITNINVDENHRKQGIGRMMYNYGQSFNPPAVHNTMPNRTKLGKQFVNHIGGKSL